MRPLLPCLLIALSAFFSNATAQSRMRRPLHRQPTTIEIITRVNDYWQQNHTPRVRAFWDEAAYHTGNMEAYRLLGCARWLSYSEEWARHNSWMGARETNPDKWKYKQYGEGQDYVLFGDWQICFQTYLDLFEIENGDTHTSILNTQYSNLKSHKIARAIEVIDYEVRRPETDFWWWADALYMVMPVMTKLYKATGEVKYLDKLYANYRWADELMYDSVEHLYYRDAKYIFPKAKTHNGGKDFWARGDGWAMAALAKVLADMPADYCHRPFFEQRFRAMAQAVARCQQPEGYWTRSMLDKSHAEGPETSGTAFFTYGLLWGINHGLLPRGDYEPVVECAWAYLTQTALQESGAVGYVQPIGERAIPGQQLTAQNEANFGVGAFLLAACEHLRFEDGSTPAALSSDGASAATVVVKNESDEYRQQLVELDADNVFYQLGIQGGRQLIVSDAAGLEIPYQLTFDDRLLIECGVAPRSELLLTLRKGTPAVFKTACYGRLYPERKDDYAWENDRGAYRVYGPALQRTGERSYGIDVWSKSTPSLVVEHRYWTEDVMMMPVVEQLRRTDRHRGDSLYRTISYHYDHGQGMDLYKVGATLGCGAPALMADNQLVFPWCFQSCEVLDNGPLRTTVLLKYQKTVFGADSIIEHRLITLDKGQNFNRMTVWYTGMRQTARLASGIVLHTTDSTGVLLGKDYVAYADPTDNPAVNNSLLFVATLYPNGSINTSLLPADGDGSSHAVGIVSGYKGQRFTYYFGSAWSKNDVRTLSEWRERIEWTLRSLRQPLKVVGPFANDTVGHHR